MKLLWRILYLLLLAAITAGVVAFAVYAQHLASTHRQSQQINSVEISMPDSILSTRIVEKAQILEWMDESGVATIGCRADSVDLNAIRDVIESHHNVKFLYVHPSYRGVLHISVGQYSPAVRLVTDGYDTYVTSDGYAFRSPSGSAVYLPVISGKYRPPFPASFEGDVTEVMRAETNECLDAIAEAENNLRRVRYGIDTLLRQRRQTMSQRLKKQFGEDDEKYALRLETFREGKARRLDYYNDLIAGRKAAEEDAWKVILERRNDLKKTSIRHDDFWNLLKFAESVHADRFLDAEIVQIEADTTYDGAPRLVLVPRSGSHRIVFGRVENVDCKLRRLRKFYDDGLRNLGWDRYSAIDLSYDGQVVCTENGHAPNERKL